MLFVSSGPTAGREDGGCGVREGQGRAGVWVRQPELRSLLLGRIADRYAKSEVEDSPLCPLPQVGVSSLGPVCHQLGELDLRKEAAHPSSPPSLPSAESCLRPESLQTSPSPAPCLAPTPPPPATQLHWLSWRSSLPGLSPSSSSLKDCPFESLPLCHPAHPQGSYDRHR